MTTLLTPALRIVSLQPSISIILRDLGCLELLVACTKYCVDAVPVLARMPVQVIHDSWTASTEEILAARPSLVLASVPYRMESLAAILKVGVPLLTLAPHSLADVYADIAILGSIVSKQEEAALAITHMQQELRTIRELSAKSAEKPLVYCEEWGKPLIHSQAWVDELIETAGGCTFRMPGATTNADTIRKANPEVLLFAWCGAGDRVPLEKIVTQRGWTSMQAVQQGRVFCIPDDWLNTPATNLLQGARAIAAILHPANFHGVQLPRALHLPLTGPSQSKME